VRAAVVAAIALLLAVFGGCQRSPVEQRGLRGQGMVQWSGTQAAPAQDELNQVPKPLRKVSAKGPTAAEVYQNVQVLGDLSKAEFARLMLSFKSWVASEEGCNLCHNAPDYASDEKYAKQVARAMIVMTRHINTDWTTHVKGTGVTCYTCHRGQAVPTKVWFAVPEPRLSGFVVRSPAIRPPTPAAARSAPPADPLSDFLLNEKPIRVVGLTPLNSGNPRTIRDTRSTYSLMTVMSESLGVNCTFCHNSRAFFAWEQSPPQRVTAWHGINMARELNRSYMTGLAGLLPASRLGPAGDGPKIYCATCHLGLNRPLNGANMIQDFPELVATKAARAAEAAASAASAVEGPTALR